MTWQEAQFLRATTSGPIATRGWVLDGVGLDERRSYPKSPSIWVLTHLNTGHAIADFRADRETAFRVASQIATAGDWSFVGLSGFRNQFPDAPIIVRDALATIKQKRGKTRATYGGGPHEDVARDIAARAAA